MKGSSSKQYSARLPQKIADTVDAFYAGQKIADVVRAAIIEKFERDSGIRLEREDFIMTQGARNDLPNRITEAEKRSRKGTRPRGRPRKVPPVLPIPPVRNVRINPDGSFSPVSAPPETSSTSRQSAA